MDPVVATDWNAYSSKPGFNEKQRSRLTKIKGALKRGAGGADKRLRREMRGMYGERRTANKQYESPLYGKGTYSQAQLDKVAIAQTRGKYGQALGEVENDIGATTQRQAQIAKYYDDWIAETNNLKTQTAAAHQAAIEQQTQNAQATQKNEGAANAQAGQQMAADAAARGQTFDPSAITKSNQASAARATTSNAQSTHLASTKNAYDTFFGNQGLITRGAKASQLQREGKYTQTLKDKLLDLRREAGDFAASRKSELDQQQYDRMLSGQALGLKKSEFRHQVGMDQAELALDQQAAADGGSSGSGGSSGGGAKPKRDITGEREFTRLRSLAKSSVSSGRLKKGQGKAYIDALVNEQGAKDDLLAQAATEYALYGGVSRATQRKVSNKYNFKLRLSPTAKKKKR